MRKPTALLLAAALAAAGCAADRRPDQTRAALAEPPPARGIGPAPAAVIGLLVGAGLIVLLIAKSGAGASPGPPI